MANGHGLTDFVFGASFLVLGNGILKKKSFLSLTELTESSEKNLFHG
jgi:hypothetical protein